MSARLYSLLGAYRARAARLIRSPEAMRRLVREASAVRDDAGKADGPLAAVREDLGNLVALARAWLAGEYRAVSLQTLALVVAALAYLLAPLDLAPDAIPIAGLVDDATFLGLVVAQIRTELDAFVRWREAASQDTALLTHL